MLQFRILLWLAAVLFVSLPAAACTGIGAAGNATTHLPAPTISGVVSQYPRGARTQLTPMAGEAVSVYRSSRGHLGVGTLTAGAAPLITHAMTDGDGSFVIAGLKPGRYFLIAPWTGRWVTLPAGKSVIVNFHVCSNCPRPP